MSSSLYSRVPLQTNRFDVRMLYLIGPPDSSPLRFGFVTTTGAAVRVYFALSYEWGTAASDSRIIIDDHEVKIRESLCAALQRIARTIDTELKPGTIEFSTPRYIWVDALCIDQSNDSERTHQVGLMRSIHNCAYKVFVWLGQAHDNSAVAMEVAKARHYNHVKDLGPDVRKMVVVPSELEDLEDSKGSPAVRWDRKKSEEHLEFHEDFERALISLMWRTYWTRLWVVQEILLANRITIYCGEDSIDWDVLIDFLSMTLGNTANLRQKLPSHWEGTKRKSSEQVERGWVNLYPNRGIQWRKLSGRALQQINTSPGVDLIKAKSWWDPRYTMLHRTILRFSSRECEDPRDKVYALLGIVDNEDDLVAKALLPDYTLTSEQLFRLVVEKHIEHEIQRIRSGEGSSWSRTTGNHSLIR